MAESPLVLLELQRGPWGLQGWEGDLGAREQAPHRQACLQDGRSRRNQTALLGTLP